MTAATVHRSTALVNPSPLPHIVEVLERLSLVAGRPGAIRPGTDFARYAVALLVVSADPERALKVALCAMACDPRWWDLAVEIGQWC